MDGAPVAVELLDGSGDAAVVAELTARLAAAGIEVGSVTATDASTSVVRYAEDEQSEADALAAALGIETAADEAATDVVVVIGADDADGLLAPWTC